MNKKIENNQGFSEEVKSRLPVKEYVNFFPKSDSLLPLILYNFHPRVLKEAFTQSSGSNHGNESLSSLRVGLFFGDSNGQLFSMLPELAGKIDIALISNSSMPEYRYTKFLLACFEKSKTLHEFRSNVQVKNPQIKEIKKKLMRDNPEVFDQHYEFHQLSSGQAIINAKDPLVPGSNLMTYNAVLDIMLRTGVRANPVTKRGDFPRELACGNFMYNEEAFRACREALVQIQLLPITLNPLDFNDCQDFARILQKHAANLSFVSLNRMHEYQNDLNLFYKNIHELLYSANDIYLMYCVANGDGYDNKICRHVSDYLNDPLITTTPALAEALPVAFNATETDDAFLAALTNTFPVYEKVPKLECSYPFSKEPGYLNIIHTLANSQTLVDRDKIRVGVLIGESCFLSLAELINHVDVLILNDIDVVVHKHNLHLVNSIRNANTKEDFEYHYKKSNPLVGEKCFLKARIKQSNYLLPFWSQPKIRRAFITDLWDVINNPSVAYQGALGLGDYYFYCSEARFQACKETIKTLKIAQTNIDLMDMDSCIRFADLLESYNATITLINLTNVHDYQEPENQLSRTIPELLRGSNNPLVMFANSYRKINKLHTNISQGLSEYFDQALGVSLESKTVQSIAVKPGI